MRKFEMVSYFQTAAGAWHWPSIILATSWLATGLFMAANLYVNRNDRLASAERERQNAQTLKSAKEELTGARQDAAEARSLVTQWEERDRPRKISSEQSARFVEFLSDSPRGKIRFKILAADNEAHTFAAALRTLLSESGFSVEPETPGFIPMGPMAGIELRVASQEFSPPHAGPLQKALQHIGIEAPAMIEPPGGGDLPSDTVLIYVAAKKK